MATINRALGMSFIESKMVDQCVITRDAAGQYDDVLDLNTGVLTSPAPTTIYTGKCEISRILTHDRPFDDGDLPSFANHFKMLVPITAYADGIRGDKVTITACDNDERMVGMWFIVTDIETASHTVYRRVIVRALESDITSIHGS